MKYVLPEKGHPIQHFIEPVIATLDFLDNIFNYTAVTMVGISGGGWTTTVVAALDTRITKCFLVAGSCPLYLESHSRPDWGNYEANTPELCRTVNYLKLYVLGGHGKSQKQLLLVNKYDACCLSGTKWETYKNIVKSRINHLGTGDFGVILDDSHREHIVSPLVMSRNLNEG